ncbi:unnamed protein product [Leptidea sinapis]|uniref:Protein kinase domain-containing protein n=1 Tax=Leptidea sinapis TaxID=189913 RepID=A0A5E4PVV8_9NEOP|nr:unnamed protein product [Leptidea sinapis]
MAPCDPRFNEIQISVYNFNFEATSQWPVALWPATRRCVMDPHNLVLAIDPQPYRLPSTSYVADEGGESSSKSDGERSSLRFKSFEMEPARLNCCERVTECVDADVSYLSPIKPKLRRFVDIYSPQHLNKTPKHRQQYLGLTNENRYNTPEKCIDVDNRCRTVKPQEKNRNVCYDCSFEGSQSFPRLKHRVRPIKMDLETPTKVKPSTDIVRVDGPNGLRFNASLAAGDVAGSPGPSQSDRIQNINSKAVFTVEPATTKILIVNNKACSLLGYSSGELCDLKFSDLLRNRSHKAFRLHTTEDGDTSEDGTIVLLSGKVVELLSKDGTLVQVSLWIRQIDSDGPCLIVAEPVTCKNVLFTIDAETGIILTCDGEDAGLLFQADAADKLIIHTLKLRTLKGTFGRTLDGGSFPLCLWISKPDTNNSLTTKTNERSIFEVNVRVTNNVSGLLVVDESGIITACNQHFAMLTFGKPQCDVIGHHIEHTCHFLICLVSDTDEDSCGAFNGSQKSACTSLNIQPSMLSMNKDKSSSALCLDKSSSLVTHTPTPTQDMVSSISTEQRNDTSALPDVTSAISGLSIDEDFCLTLSKSRSENILRSEESNPRQTKENDSIYYTSQHSQEITPTGMSPKMRLSLDCSKYKCKDRSSVSLDFSDSNETSADFLTPINELPPSGCDIEALPKYNGNESVDSLSNDVDLETQTESAPQKKFEDEPPETPCLAKRALRSVVTTSTPTHSRNSRTDCECTTHIHKDGTYRDVVYTVSSMQLSSGRTVRCVWLGKKSSKGAYGCVKMAYRRSDRLLTVAKFILKEKVGAQFWVDGPDGRKKHGAGMDLFEFIERRPRLDEPLLSYIFRQIGQAVEYLHSLNILHRDIKDENVIIDNKFHVKLIDFGSATFMSKDTLFSTFYGTTEYCSPEVLAGNKYAGPELEMWSMGITLYVLTFFVNPFTDIEDTIQEHLLRWILCKEPSQRCTVAQLMAHPWMKQPVNIKQYIFHEILECGRSSRSQSGDVLQRQSKLTEKQLSFVTC